MEEIVFDSTLQLINQKATEEGEPEIFEGKLHGRPVLVRRVSRADYDNIYRGEFKKLSKMQDFKYILDFMVLMVVDGPVYMVSPNCSTTTLQDLVSTRDRSPSLWINKKNKKNRGKYFPSKRLMNLIREVVDGLIAVHSARKICRDLNAKNVFITGRKHKCVKLSGIGRNASQGRSLDLYKLGCLIYQCLTNQELKPESYFKDKKKLKSMTANSLKFVAHLPEARFLIKNLVGDVDSRLQAKEVRHHPFFWDMIEGMRFLDFVDRWMRTCDETDVTAFDAYCSNIYDWASHIDAEVNKQKKGSFNDGARDLVRFIRNLHVHYAETSSAAQVILKNNKGGVYNYFIRRFPTLVSEAYGYMRTFATEDMRSYKFLPRVSGN